MLAGKRVVLVAAMAANRVIGLGNDIPWRIPGEQKRFRELTMNQLVVMGRRTFESIGKLPYADPVYLTEIDLHPPGDAFFSELPERFSLKDSVDVPGRDTLHVQYLRGRVGA